MLLDRVSNPGPLTSESGALPIVLRGPAGAMDFGLKTLRLVYNTCLVYTVNNYPAGT